MAKAYSTGRYTTQETVMETGIISQLIIQVGHC